MRREIKDEVYMKYDDYFKYIDRIGTKRDYNYENVSLDGVLNKSQIDSTIKSTYKSAFSELLRHIHQGIITYNTKKEGCWYISYILHKEVYKILNQEYTKNIFDAFMEFIRTYNRLLYSNSSICLHDILHVKTETYEIMDELYRLYDEYMKYRPIHTYHIKNNCNAFSAFLHSYNSFISTYESGTPFFNDVLNNFDKEIKKAVSKYKDECNGFTYNVGTLHLYDPPPPTPVVVQPEVRQVDQSALAVNGLQDSKQEVAHHSGESRTPEAAESVSPHRSEETHDPETTNYPGRAHARVTENDQLTSDHPDRTHRYGREQENMIGTESRYSHHFRTTGSSAELGYLDKSPFAPNLEGQNQDDGFISNVKNTLSGIVQNVEPAPILGVSGGMGALFLLFKYTPVGTFFGGRRGRFHQIPSSFRGFPPGEFPNFQEYDSGFIGYAPMNINPLAE